MVSTLRWGHVIKMRLPRHAYHRQLLIEPLREQCQAKLAMFKGVLSLILLKINLLERN